jgi:hypothetical protein
MDPYICPICDSEVIDPVEWPLISDDPWPELVCRGCRDEFLLEGQEI